MDEHARPEINMEVNNFKCAVNLPNAPKGEGIHQLPPYNTINTHRVDEYAACPYHWMRSNKKSASYFFKVEQGRHLWLDFNDNFNNTHDVAILISIQKINPVTGQKINGLKLEQYRSKCPTHNIDFNDSRFCPECDFKWPAQNYITTASCPEGLLWIDGWRTDKGTIRGFLITDDIIRGIASQLIGDDRSSSIGIAFFTSKKPKQPKISFEEFQKFNSIPFGDYTVNGQPYTFQSKPNTSYCYNVSCYNEESVSTNPLRSAKQFEIGGGSKIIQDLDYPDNNSLDYYEDEPSGIIYGNYCDSVLYDSIISRGRNEEGFMKGLLVGN